MLKRLLGFLPLVVMSSQVHAQHSSVDLNRPVTNPALMQAMSRVAKDGSDASKDALLAELQRANYLVAIYSDRLSPGQKQRDGLMLIPKGRQMDVITAGKDGKHYLLLFTDWEALSAYTDKAVSVWVLPARDAWDFVLQDKTFDGVVINPAHNALPLQRPMVEYLRANAKK